MEPSEHLSGLIEKILGPTVCSQSGGILYSSLSTLRRGTLYLMGLNPGGDPIDIRETIGEDIKKLTNRPSNWSAYTDEPWGADSGERPHQKRVVEICRLLGQDVREVFATNAIFVRTPDAAALKNRYNELKDRCFKVHQYFLSIVRPKTIICLGNGSFSSFSILKEWLNVREHHNYGRSFRDGKWFDSTIRLEHLPYLQFRCRIIGLPHPSRFAPSEMLSEFLIREATRD